MLSDQDFMRYSRQLLLEEIGPVGQEQLAKSTVLIVGLGGLGSPAALYLAAAGVGTLLLADDDLLHISNLQRQILFRSSDTGKEKAVLAANTLHELNPSVHLQALTQRIDVQQLNRLPARPTVVLDCSDNMATRHLLNRWCIEQQIPLVSASAVGFSGQLLVLTPPWTQGCYRCLWPEPEEPERNCRNSGVAGPVVGMMGSLQALEAVKLITTGHSAASGQLILFDARELQWRRLQLTPAADCPVCGEVHADYA